MAKKPQIAKNDTNGGKIAAFVAKYSNAGSGAGYKSAIESFLRCIFKLAKGEPHDYEAYLDQYLSDKSRDVVKDLTAFTDYLIENSRGGRESGSRQSARQRMTYAGKFLRMHGKYADLDLLRDIKRETKGGKATKTKVLSGKIICEAVKGANVRDRAIFLSLASSGMRLNELLSLSMDDIEMDADPVTIHIRASKTKTKVQRYTFVTNEAKAAIQAWLKVRDEFVQQSAKHNQNLIAMKKSAPVQTDSDLLFPVSDNQVNMAWEACLRKAGLYEKDSSTNYNVYRIHSFRAFFLSQMQLAGQRTIGEELAGHLGYLDGSYRQVGQEYAAEEYKKLQHVLTVCISPVVKKELEQQKEAITTLTEKTTLQGESVAGLRIINQELQAQIARQDEKINTISTRLEEFYNYFQAKQSETLLHNEEKAVDEYNAKKSQKK